MRVVLVHGSVANGPMTWPSLEPLRERFDVVLPSRGGYPRVRVLDFTIGDLARALGVRSRRLP